MKNKFWVFLVLILSTLAIFIGYRIHINGTKLSYIHQKQPKENPHIILVEYEIGFLYQPIT